MEGAKRLLGEGLLTSEGEFHLRQRRIVGIVYLALAGVFVRLL